jgi:polyhydroxybutyrate depolymerase
MKNVFLSLTAILMVTFSAGQDFSIIHDGLTRTYRLYLPVGYNADSIYPLVINMHGLGSNAFEQEFYTEFDEVADSARLVIAYPNGIDETWNISSTTGTDDVGFISALIDTIASQYSINQDRVYATGMSMGGFMSYRLACELSGRIVAIASVAGLQAFYPCNPDRPVPVAQFHGTADQVVPYAGVSATISNWINYNLCPDTPVVTDLPDIDTNDNSTVTISYYGLCDEDTEVILYTIVNGGHTWPGASYIIGITNQDIKASYEIWNFFNKYTLQGSTGIDHEGDLKGPGCKFFPNPVNSLATVELSEDIDDSFYFMIINIAGKIVLKQKIQDSTRFLIDCSDIPPGFYIAALDNGQIKSYQKIIIE